MQLKAILLALVLSIFATTSGADVMERKHFANFWTPSNTLLLIFPRAASTSVLYSVRTKKTL